MVSRCRVRSVHAPQRDHAHRRPTVAGEWRVRDVVAHILDGSLRRLSFHRDGQTPPAPEPAGLGRVGLRDVRLQRARGGAAGRPSRDHGVAGRWGFLYLGRFAAYREKFGERPSDTLRSA